MDPWEMFSYLCKQVVEEGNVFLDVFVIDNRIEFMLMPYDEMEGAE